MQKRIFLLAMSSGLVLRIDRVVVRFVRPFHRGREKLLRCHVLCLPARLGGVPLGGDPTISTTRRPSRRSSDAGLPRPDNFGGRRRRSFHRGLAFSHHRENAADRLRLLPRPAHPSGGGQDVQTAGSGEHGGRPLLPQSPRPLDFRYLGDLRCPADLLCPRRHAPVP